MQMQGHTQSRQRAFFWGATPPPCVSATCRPPEYVCGANKNGGGDLFSRDGRRRGRGCRGEGEGSRRRWIPLVALGPSLCPAWAPFGPAEPGDRTEHARARASTDAWAALDTRATAVTSFSTDGFGQRQHDDCMPRGCGVRGSPPWRRESGGASPAECRREAFGVGEGGGGARRAGAVRAGAAGASEGDEARW